MLYVHASVYQSYQFPTEEVRAAVTFKVWMEFEFIYCICSVTRGAITEHL
jgi:hypothetical protein